MKAALALVSAVLVWSSSAASEGGESCLVGRPVCRVLADLADQVELVAAEVERRTTHIGRLADLEERLAMHEERHLSTTSEGDMPGESGLKEAHQEILQLKERLDSQEALYKDLLKAVEEIKKNEILPFPQPFVSNIEDNMLGDSSSDDSLLLAKVEKVEIITSEVQEELSRVRRHLEEDLNATRHDVRMLNDKFEMAAIVNRFEDRNETRETDEDKVLHFEEELDYLRAIVTDLRENSTEALGAARVNEARVAELANASEWVDTTMRKDIQNIQTQLDALAQVQLDECLTRSEIRNLTFEVLAPFDQRVALISEDLAIAEHRVDSLEKSTKHKLKDIDSKLRNATLSAMAEHVTRGERLEEAVEDASSYEAECGAPPPSPDPHLLIFPEEGGRRLGFACRPPGTYVLTLPDNVMSCVRSQWSGRLPECMRLPTEEDIQADLVPTIVVDPLVDAPNSGLGTGTRGELVAHPRTSLVLHCLYPAGAPPPSWRKIQEPADDEEGAFESVAVGPTRKSIRIPGASPADSGIYECVTPGGRANRVTLVVKSVVCPPLPPPAFHRPHPEGEERVLSTLAEVRCRGRPATARCTAEGTWEAPPGCDQREDAYPWDCPPLPAGVLFDLNGGGRSVLFRCGRAGSWLVGPAFTRCQEDGQWTHARLPECHHTAL
ncbi:hypothetical protein JTE90_003718 [Oedothorax gibbosus]|uniref:Uncharacterized protein n=1 Tax=Oedothorax gibbosus TaxID=931172 RepID=A0AAV6VAY2_9ARAC|nr:hypothetical protein JTE90_003718 [Oedothorax gibbosus]